MDGFDRISKIAALYTLASLAGKPSPAGIDRSAPVA
jgi:hypothetical protein